MTPHSKPKILITNIKFLVCSDNNENITGFTQKKLNYITNAFLLIENGIIKTYGQESNSPYSKECDIHINAQGGAVLPSFCDCHTHLVFAGKRYLDFFYRASGLSYAQISEKTGGIKYTQIKTSEASLDSLLISSLKKIALFEKFGYGALEIKSGYGLSIHDEIKILKVIKKIKENSTIFIKSTYLGLHAKPPSQEKIRENYVNERINLIPYLHQEDLMDFVDIFCEKDYYSKEEAERLFSEAQKFKIPVKMHVNQFNLNEAFYTALKHEATSIDHLEIISDEQLEALSKSKTIPVGLPLSSFFLNKDYIDARKILDKGIPLALASDFNPGTAPIFSPFLILYLAITKLQMTIEEAINGLTICSALAMNAANTIGSISPNKIANIIITYPIENLLELAYSPDINFVKFHIVAGEKIIHQNIEPWN